MMDTTRTQDILAQAREDMLRKLVDLAMEGRRPAEMQAYRDRAEDLIRELALMEQAIRSITPVPSTKYARHKRAIEAILEFLDATGRPCTEPEIISGLIEGGFRGAAPGTSLVIEKSIRSYLHGTGLKTGYIRKVGELIGRGEWEDARFSL